MKLQSNQTINLLRSLSNEEIEILTAEVRETIAVDYKAKRIFSAA